MSPGDGSGCDAERRADDHLSLVAGISKLQITELDKHGITPWSEFQPQVFRTDDYESKALKKIGAP
jgi:uncharacterized protein